MYRLLITTALALVFGTSAYMSVYGLAAVFAAHLPVVVCMGAGMELGKLLVVIHLHRRWPALHLTARMFYMLVVAILVTITSCEIAGFLAQSHVATASDLESSQAEVAALDQEAALLERQIAVTDQTLAGLPEGYVSRRIAERERTGYGAAQKRLVTISRQRAELTASMVEKTAHAGPVFAVARLAGLDAATAATVFILVLVAVLEPLSIGLSVAASAAWQPGSSGSEAADPKVRASGGRTGADTRSAFKKIVNDYNLSTKEVAAITGRKRTGTAQAWMNGTARIPPKALRTLRRWAVKQKNRLRLVAHGT
jgi:cell division protein FtsB